MRRTARGYDGVKPPGHKLSDVLGAVMGRVLTQDGNAVQAITQAWPEIIGPQFAAATRVISYSDGFLCIGVMNSTLYSLLAQNEKKRLLAALRQRFPKMDLKGMQLKLC